jgi:lipopolysaccharide biosynthesis regulator YciM
MDPIREEQQKLDRSMSKVRSGDYKGQKDRAIFGDRMFSSMKQHNQNCEIEVDVGRIFRRRGLA